MGAGTVFELGIKSDFRETGVLHPCDVANPTMLSCHQQNLDSRQVADLWHFSIWNLVLPLDMCNTA